MLAVNFGPLNTSGIKRDYNGLFGETNVNESYTDNLPVKRFRRLNENPQSPVLVNRMFQRQHENEMKEMHCTLQKKEKEINEKDQKIQTLQNQLAASSSKVQQFDALAKCFMDQNSKLKQKEEEVSSLTTVVQKLLAENKALKNQLYILDRERMVNILNC